MVSLCLALEENISFKPCAESRTLLSVLRTHCQEICALAVAHLFSVLYPPSSLADIMFFEFPPRCSPIKMHSQASPSVLLFCWSKNEPRTAAGSQASGFSIAGLHNCGWVGLHACRAPSLSGIIKVVHSLASPIAQRRSTRPCSLSEPGNSTPARNTTAIYQLSCINDGACRTGRLVERFVRLALAGLALENLLRSRIVTCLSRAAFTVRSWDEQTRAPTRRSGQLKWGAERRIAPSLPGQEGAPAGPTNKGSWRIM